MNFRKDIDYTIDEQGNLVMTADYLRRRGYCCENGCRNCPYGFDKKASKKNKMNVKKADLEKKS